MMSEETLMMLPVGFARLSDVGFEVRSHGIADEGVQGLVWRIFTERQNSHLSGDGFVRVDDARPLDQGETERPHAPVSH